MNVSGLSIFSLLLPLTACPPAVPAPQTTVVTAPEPLASSQHAPKGLRHQPVPSPSGLVNHVLDSNATADHVAAINLPDGSALIVGESQGPEGEAYTLVQRTDDKGGRWDVTFVIQQPFVGWDAAGDRVWLITGHGQDGNPRLYRSTDGGQRWMAINQLAFFPPDGLVPPLLTQVRAVDHESVAVRVEPTEGGPAKWMLTTDAGDSWNVVTSPPPRTVDPIQRPLRVRTLDDFAVVERSAGEAWEPLALLPMVGAPL